VNGWAEESPTEVSMILMGDWLRHEVSQLLHAAVVTCGEAGCCCCALQQPLSVYALPITSVRSNILTDLIKNDSL